jgi:regulator of replication initiation timing
MRESEYKQNIIMTKRKYIKVVFKAVSLLVDENERLKRENRKLKRLLSEGLALINRIEKQQSLYRTH